MLVGSSNPLLIICSTFRLGSLSVGPVREGRALVLRIIGGAGGALGLLLTALVEVLVVPELEGGEKVKGELLLMLLSIIPGNWTVIILSVSKESELEEEKEVKEVKAAP
jgi:hypothetical protein